MAAMARRATYISQSQQTVRTRQPAAGSACLAVSRKSTSRCRRAEVHWEGLRPWSAMSSMLYLSQGSLHRLNCTVTSCAHPIMRFRQHSTLDLRDVGCSPSPCADSGKGWDTYIWDVQRIEGHLYCLVTLLQAGSSWSSVVMSAAVITRAGHIVYNSTASKAGMMRHQHLTKEGR